MITRVYLLPPSSVIPLVISLVNTIYFLSLARHAHFAANSFSKIICTPPICTSRATISPEGEMIHGDGIANALNLNFKKNA